MFRRNSNYVAALGVPADQESRCSSRRNLFAAAPGVVVAQEKFFQSWRLADQAAYAGVAEDPDEFPEACVVDLGAHRIAVDADVLDTLDSGEVAWITGHFGFDRGAAEVTHRVQRSAFDGLAGPDDGDSFTQRFGFGQDVAGQQDR